MGGVYCNIMSEQPLILSQREPMKHSARISQSVDFVSGPGFIFCSSRNRVHPIRYPASILRKAEPLAPLLEWAGWYTASQWTMANCGTNEIARQSQKSSVRLSLGSLELLKAVAPI